MSTAKSLAPPSAAPNSYAGRICLRECSNPRQYTVMILLYSRSTLESFRSVAKPELPHAATVLRKSQSWVDNLVHNQLRLDRSVVPHQHLYVTICR
jgi:hypothetical protein